MNGGQLNMTLLAHLLDNGHDPADYLFYYEDSMLCEANKSDYEMAPEQFTPEFLAVAHLDQAEDEAIMSDMQNGWNAAGRDFHSEIEIIRKYVEEHSAD